MTNGLGQVRDWNQTEGARRGEELGSVCDIDRRITGEALELDVTRNLRSLGEVYNKSSVQTSGAGEVY